jgi:hypothetical protein
MSNHERYLAEQKNKYLAYLGELAEYTQTKPEKARSRRRAAVAAAAAAAEPVPVLGQVRRGNGVGQHPTQHWPAAAEQQASAGLPQRQMPLMAWQNVETTRQEALPADTGARFYRQIQPSYDIHTLILDSAHRDTAQFPAANDFILKLSENIKNVALLRILKTEFYDTPAQSAYLYLNGYVKTYIGNDRNATVLGRIGPNAEHYPAVTGNILNDPYAYVFRPMEPRLNRFHIKLLDHNGALVTVSAPSVILTIALYCLPT